MNKYDQASDSDVAAVASSHEDIDFDRVGIR
jgi:hypothetical protein